MATKRVNVDIVAKDKSQQALNRVRGSLDKVKASVFNVRNALAGLGAGLVIRNLVNTGQEIESLQVRLKFLFGTAEEGAKAFDNMAKFAAKVPFSLEQIKQGAGVLSVVSKDADELADILEITGNVAAVTGLDFRTASEQIQRSLSAGIASADLFREKGVRDLLGFKAGATVTAEETAEAFERVFGKGGKFGGATDELAKTFEGTLSMIGDKFFTFKKTILEAGFFPELKKQFGDLDNFLEENGRAIDEIAIKIGKGLAQAVKSTANVVKFLADNFEILKGIFFTIITLKVAAFFHTLTTSIVLTNKALMSLNFNFGMLGRRLKFLTTAMALMNGQFGLMATLEKRKVTLKETARASIMLGEKISNLTKFQEENTKSLDKNTKSAKEYKNALVDIFIEQARLEDRQFGMSDRDKELVKEHTKFLNLQKETLSTINDHMRVKNKLTAEQAGLFDLDKIIDDLKKEEQQVNKTMQVYAEYGMQRRRLSLEIFRDEREQAKNNQQKMFDDALENNAKMVALKKQGNQEVFNNTKSSLQALSGLNRTAFEAFKRFQIAEATIEAVKGAATAFSTYAANPFLATAVAASHLAKGMAMVAQIKSTNYRAGGGSVNKDQAYMVGEKGPEMFVPSGSGKIVPNNQMGGQPVNVNFNINTVDARGFNELLTNSRGVIVNMINSAVNETGRQAIV